MGNPTPIPAGGARMAVPLSHGEQAQWPATAVPIETLEAAAQDWYEFRDNSFRVRLWRNHGWISCAMVWALVLSPLYLFVWLVGLPVLPASFLSVHSPMPIFVGIFFLLMAFSLCFMYGLMWKIKDEVSERLATPLSRALASSGWIVEAECLENEKYTYTPEGLPEEKRCLCLFGWIWLDFKPAVQASEQTSMMAFQGNC